MLKVAKWRETPFKDSYGETISEGYIPEIGWCRYSWRLGALLINGQWHDY